MPGVFTASPKSSWVFYDASCFASTTTTPAQTSPTAVVVPKNCESALKPSYKIIEFKFFNSSHNLDCVNGPDPKINNGTTCIMSRPDGGLVACDPSYQECSSCGIPACYTGMPDQPLGYGPPDTVSIKFEDQTCFQANPQSIRRYQVGEGFVQCGGAYHFLDFYGNSNSPKSTGSIQVHPQSATCTDGKMIQGQYNVQFPMTCTRDAQNNATCTAATPLYATLTSFVVASS